MSMQSNEKLTVWESVNILFDYFQKRHCRDGIADNVLRNTKA